MGFLLWAALTAFALFAGLAVALKIGRAFGICEQIVAAVIVAITAVIMASQVLGYTSLLYSWALASLVTAECMVLLLWARPTRASLGDFGRRLGSAARRSIAPGSVIAFLPFAAMVLYLGAYIYLLPTWTWDALWYHNPTAAYAYQDHSLRWHDASTNAPFINAFPKVCELLALWNVIFAPDDRFIDAVQLPMAFVGIMALAGMCRRAGASPSLALGLGLCWLLLPAVFLNIPSGYNDVAIGTLRFASLLFLARADATDAHRFFGTLSLGLYVGSKDYAALHAAVLMLVVALILWRQLARGEVSRRRWFGELAAMSVAILFIGGATYVRDLWLFKNPVWPAKVHLFGRELTGTWALTRFNTPPWGGADDWHALWRSFTTWTPHYEVDVRAGGFGPLWTFVLLPLTVVALVGAAIRWPLKKKVGGTLMLVLLVATALLTTAKWWPRHTLGLPAAGLVAIAMIASWWQARWPGQVALAGIAVFAVCQTAALETKDDLKTWNPKNWHPKTWTVSWPALEGFRAPLSLLKQLAHEPFIERDVTKVAKWQPEWIGRREDILQPGDAAVYDDSVSFSYLLWRHDWKNRVLFRPVLPSEKAETWVQRIEGEGARWASVRNRSAAEQALKTAAGWTLLGACPVEHCSVFVRPRPGVVVNPPAGPKTEAAAKPPAMPFTPLLFQHKPD